MMKNIIKIIIGTLRGLFFGIVISPGVYIGKNCSIKGKKSIVIGKDTTIRPGVQIWTSKKGKINIFEGVEIGERCRISIANELKIGNKVLISPNVYITDSDHEYRDINKPIIDQGIVKINKRVVIGEDSYVGINSVIVGNVSIGKHCIIGANTVVTKSIPDFSVAVGNPMRIIAKYNFEKNAWIKN